MEGGTSGGTTSSTLLSGGGRQRFEVELRPGETTIVSWKKLIKDANKAAKTENDSKNIDNKAVAVPSVSNPSVPVPVAVNPALDSRAAPISGQTAENEGNDAPPGSRFSAVIEKIERLYMGKNSSDEEDLNDVPDDDEYDSDDSFIDDAELDDYFQVDYSAVKHDGFFVNRGKLERTNEPTVIPTEQPKKRRRKDSTKGHNENNNENVPNKQIKINKKEGKKLVSSVDKNPTTPSRSITIPTEDLRYQSPIIALGTVVKKSSDPKNLSDPSSTKVTNGEGKVTAKNIDKPKNTVPQSKKHGSKSKDGSLIPAVSSQKIVDKGADVALKSQGQMCNNSEELNQSALSREKNVIHQHADIKASDNAQHPNTPQTVRKEGLIMKAKSANTVLEKAIRDLEKTVAEIRPPSTEVTEADNPSQAVKRRMPPEIKQKLAKVARVAHAIRGKLSKELLNRLMSIVGHLIQIRSLKRNLQNMVDMGVSAKKEKDAKLQQLKKEVDEMVKIRVPLMKPEAIEQQAGSSDDFQENSTKEKVHKSKFATDDALEDKLCDLYDLYIDGLDEDAGPQLRKLYAELVELWPNGCMDNQGIKRAIYRAKERKKALHRHKDQEKIKRKKLLAPNAETVTVNPISTGQVQLTSDKVVTAISAPVRSISSSMAANTAPRPPSSSHGPTTDKQKHEKLKVSTNNQTNTVSEVLVKKKTKRKPEAELDLKKSTQGEEKGKSSKQIVGGVTKPAATQPPVGPTSGGAQPVQPLVNGTVDMV